MSRKTSPRLLALSLLPVCLAACSGAVSSSTPTAAAPALPTGYALVDNTSVHLAFAIPEDWASISGTAPGAVYAEYGPPGGAAYPTFRAAADSEVGLSPSADTVISSISSSLAAGADGTTEVIDDYHITIAGEQASVVEYQLTRSTSEAYFSIMAVVLGPDRRGYLLQWTSTIDGEDDVRTLLDNMVPFFQFLP